MRLIFAVFLTLSIAANSYAQVVTRIRGSVIDSETNEPLPFVNITFSGTATGTTTDIEGNYSLEAKAEATKLVLLAQGQWYREINRKSASAGVGVSNAKFKDCVFTEHPDLCDAVLEKYKPGQAGFAESAIAAISSGLFGFPRPVNRKHILPRDKGALI